MAAAAVMRASHRAARVTAAPAVALTSLPRESRNTCQWLSQRFERLNARRIACWIAHRFHLLTAIPSIYTPQCLSNSTSDGSSIPLVDGISSVYALKFLSMATPTVFTL